MLAIGPQRFAGSWIDSLGNSVHVQDNGPLGLRASLARPSCTGPGLTLTICQVGSSWKCGHYDLIEQESSLSQLVWQDRRSLDRVTVWKRKDAAHFPRPGMTAGHAGGIDDLFCAFGLPAPSEAVAARANEDMRERVLQETLARLLSSKRKRPHTVGTPSFGMPNNGTDVRATSHSDVALGEEELVPDWKRRLCTNGRQPVQVPAPRIDRNEEDLLDSFCEAFNLDLLARKSLYALADDEAANVIGSLQGRLGHVKNPSAVVMIAIRSVASKVGRRYWGSQEVGRQDAPAVPSIGAHCENSVLKPSEEQMGQPLQVFTGSPVEDSDSGDESDDDGEDGEVLAVADPYMMGVQEAPIVVDLIDDDEEHGGVVDAGSSNPAVDVSAGADEEDAEAEASPSCFFEDASGVG